MFIAIYTLILAFSTGFAAWMTLTLGQRLTTMLGLAPERYASGLFALLPIIGFLIVVGAPAAMLVGALVLIGTALCERFQILAKAMRWLVPLMLCAIATTLLSIPAFGKIPPSAMGGLLALVWYAITLSGEWMAEDFPAGSLGVALPLAPLLAGPFVFDAPSWIGLDMAILLSGLLGVLLVRAPGTQFGLARVPFAFLTGWLILESAIHGAWIPALASLVAWAVAIAYGLARDSSGHPHATPF